MRCGRVTRSIVNGVGRVFILINKYISGSSSVGRAGRLDRSGRRIVTCLPDKKQNGCGVWVGCDACLGARQVGRFELLSAAKVKV
jgi:hypothetical protein